MTPEQLDALWQDYRKAENLHDIDAMNEAALALFHSASDLRFRLSQSVEAFQKVCDGQSLRVAGMREAAALAAYKAWDGEPEDGEAIRATIRALTDADADAALAASYKRVREEALRKMTQEKFNPMIFYPVDRAGYETAAERKAIYADCVNHSLQSYPGAGGDVIAALCMSLRQAESVIKGAETRTDGAFKAAILALIDKEAGQ